MTGRRPSNAGEIARSVVLGDGQPARLMVSRDDDQRIRPSGSSVEHLLDHIVELDHLADQSR